MTADATRATRATDALGALGALVDVLVGQPLDALPAAVLQGQMVAVAPQAARLEGWLQAVAGWLDALTGGRLPTEDGGSRSVAGWLAEVRHGTASAAGRDLRTAGLLRTHGRPTTRSGPGRGVAGLSCRQSAPGW